MKMTSSGCRINHSHQGLQAQSKLKGQHMLEQEELKQQWQAFHQLQEDQHVLAILQSSPTTWRELQGVSYAKASCILNLNADEVKYLKKTYNLQSKL